MRVLIVDDEPIVRRDLRRLLARETDVTVVGEAGDGLEALDCIDAMQPDVVLLDVAMPELDGFGVVRALDPVDAPLVVFVTAHGHHALAAIDAEAVDYLLKPFDAERLGRALQRVRRRLGGDDGGRAARAHEAVRRAEPYVERLAVRTTDRAVIIEVGRIRRIEAAGNYANLLLADTSYLTRRTMRDLGDLLDPARFVRVHRSHIVNLAAVREYRLLGDGDAELRLDNGERVPVSRGHRAELEGRMGGVA